MTVANTTNRTSAVGNAAIGQEVPFSFPYAATSDITVYSRVTATGVETLLAETTNYTLTAASDTGGTLTTVTAVAVTAEIHIIRDTPKTQALDLEAGGSFSAEDVEDALDKNTKLIIENKDHFNRTLKFPDTDPTSSFADMPNSIDRASKNLTFDSDGKPTASVSVEEGSVTFSGLGTNIAEAATAATVRGLVELSPTDDVEFADIVVKDPLIDIRAYLPAGYVTDGSVDYTTQIQLAFDDAAYKTVFIPSGIWQITSTIDVPVSCSVIGIGFNSRILATACDAFSIPVSGSLGGTEWSKLQIYGDGDGSAAYIAIKVMGTADSDAYSAGITFRKLYINKIGTAFKLRSLAQGIITDCAINDVWYGIHIEGKVIRTQIVGNEITRDYLGTGVVTGGAGDSTGIIINDIHDYDPGGATTGAPESLMISHNGVAGFEVGTDIIVGQYVTIFSNDLDRQTVNGISFTQKTSNLTIRDNWIVVTGAAALYGIQGRSGAIDPTYALIEHNIILATNTPHANSMGIRIGTNQDNVIVQYNYLGGNPGFQTQDIYFIANKSSIIRNNICASADPTTYSILMDAPSGPHWVSENTCVKLIHNANSSVPEIVCNNNQVVCNNNQVVMTN